ncbi:MAG: transposase [Magnetococcales bacterium]|nr:transposase [Magnetococcales bacterium]NGZ26156.1 transposase [Magnetococcales bacterium]
MAVEDIEHSRTKARSPQTKGICERFHKTTLDEFYSLEFQRKLFTSLEELQTELDAWIDLCNREGSHSGNYFYGKTPMQTFLDSKKNCTGKKSWNDFTKQTEPRPYDPILSD